MCLNPVKACRTFRYLAGKQDTGVWSDWPRSEDDLLVVLAQPETFASLSKENVPEPSRWALANESPVRS
jgi:hypothetical protein